MSQLNEVMATFTTTELTRGRLLGDECAYWCCYEIDDTSGGQAEAHDLDEALARARSLRTRYKRVVEFACFVALDRASRPLTIVLTKSPSAVSTCEPSGVSASLRRLAVAGRHR